MLLRPSLVDVRHLKTFIHCFLPQFQGATKELVRLACRGSYEGEIPGRKLAVVTLMLIKPSDAAGARNALMNLLSAWAWSAGYLGRFGLL